MYEKASFITDYAVKVQMVLDKDRSAKRYKIKDIRGLQKLIEKKSDNLDPLYIKWIIQKYSQNKMQMVEDILSKAIPALERYQDLKKRNQLQLTHKNLQAIKNIHELLDIMDEYQDAQSRSEKKDSVEQGFYDGGEAELVHDDSKIKVVVPKTEKASCYFGMGTKWCTTGDRNNQFNNYTSDGYDLYYIFFKGVTSKKNYKWAVAQRRKRKYDIELFDAENKYPPLRVVLRIRKKYSVLQKIFKDTVQFDTKISEESQLNFVMAGYPYRMLFDYIETPSDDVQKYVIRNYGPTIMREFTLSRNVLMDLLRENPGYIEWVDDQDEEMQLTAVESLNYKRLRKLPRRPYFMQANIVSIMKNPSLKVLKTLVKKYWKTIAWMTDPPTEVQKIAVRKHRSAIMYISDPPQEIQDIHNRKWT